MGEKNTTQHINDEQVDRISWQKFNASKIKVKKQAKDACLREHNVLKSLKFCAESQAFKVKVAEKPFSQK